MNLLLHSLSTLYVYQSGLQAAVPLLLAALGGLLCSRVGVFNIALEGKMLAGALAAVAGSWFLGGPAAGTLLAAGVGGVVGFGMGGMTVKLSANPIVLGLGVNLAMSGMTAFSLPLLFHVTGTFYSSRLRGLPTWGLGPFRHVPVLGPVLSGQTPLFWVSLALVPVVSLVLYRSPWGLRLRGVGENPAAAATLGVSPNWTQIVVLTVAGALCGMAGAQLSLGIAQEFTQDMTAGRGFVALVAVLFGRDNPWAVAGTAVGFGIVEAVSFQLQASNLPSQLLEMIPYVLAMLLLVVIRDTRSRVLGLFVN